MPESSLCMSQQQIIAALRAVLVMCDSVFIHVGIMYEGYQPRRTIYIIIISTVHEAQA